MVDPRTESIELVSPQYEDWCEEFDAERSRLRDVLGTNDLATACNRIVHVGSTSVPELSAKDIVDIDIVVEDEAVTPVSRAIIAELGGDRFENSDEWQPVFRRADDQRFNDHVFAVSSERWKVSVATRAVLETDPILRDEYERLKRELASNHDEMDAYSKAKTEFITKLLQTARDADDLNFDFSVPLEL